LLRGVNELIWEEGIFAVVLRALLRGVNEFVWEGIYDGILPLAAISNLFIGRYSSFTDLNLIISTVSKPQLSM
jgi:hypothetical protein